MNFTKRIISAILCAVLTLSIVGCAKGDGSARPSSDSTSGSAAAIGGKGAWVEEEISLPKDIAGYSTLKLLSDGRMVMSGRNNPDDYMQTKVYLLTSTDSGKTWAQEEIAWDNENNGVLTNINLSENGTMFFQTVVMGETREDTKFRCFIQRPKEEIKEYSFEGINWNDNNNLIVEFIDDTTMYVISPIENDMNKLHAFYDISENKLLGYLNLNETISSIPIQLGIAPIYGEKRIYFSNYNGVSGGYELCSAGAGEDISVEFEKIPSEKGVHSAFSDKSGTFYFANEEGIFSIAKNGTICEKIVDAVGKQLNTLESYKLCRAEDGSFFSIAFGEHDEETDFLEIKAFRYYFDETAIAPSGDALHIWSLNESPTIREAITAFSKENSEIIVNYTVGIPSGDTSLNREDVIRTLNTEILSGSGPDVIIFDGVDYEPYIKSGMLASLSEIVDSSELAPFISDAFYENGESFVLPARYSIPVIYGDKGTMSGLETLTGLQQAILACNPRKDANGNEEAYYSKIAEADRFGMSFLSIQQLCDFVLQTSANALISDNKVNITQAEKAYAFINAIGTHYKMADYRPDNEQPRNGIAIGNDNIVLMDGGYEYSVTQHAKYGWDIMLSSTFSTHLDRYVEDTKTRIYCDILPQPGLCDNGYVPTVIAGINAQTQRLDDAQKLLKSFFSDKLTQSNANGISTVKSIHEKAIASADEATKNILTTLKTPVLSNSAISSAFFKSAEKMIMGEFEEKAAAADFEKSMALYLAEKE